MLLAARRFSHRRAIALAAAFALVIANRLVVVSLSAASAPETDRHPGQPRTAIVHARSMPQVLFEAISATPASAPRVAARQKRETVS